MLEINDRTPVSDLVALQIGDAIKQGDQKGIIEKIDFDEANNYWEMILNLEGGLKVYVRRQKTMC